MGVERRISVRIAPEFEIAPQLNEAERGYIPKRPIEFQHGKGAHYAAVPLVAAS